MIISLAIENFDGLRLCSQVRSPLKTRVIHTPSGLVSANTRAKKSKICNQPQMFIKVQNFSGRNSA